MPATVEGMSIFVAWLHYSNVTIVAVVCHSLFSGLEATLHEN